MTRDSFKLFLWDHKNIFRLRCIKLSRSCQLTFVYSSESRKRTIKLIHRKYRSKIEAAHIIRNAQFIDNLHLLFNYYAKEIFHLLK